MLLLLLLLLLLWLLLLLPLLLLAPLLKLFHGKSLEDAAPLPLFASGKWLGVVVEALCLGAGESTGGGNRCGEATSLVV